MIGSRHQFGIRSRLSLVAALPVLLLLGAAGVVLVTQATRLEHEDASNRAAAHLRSLAVPCARSIAVHAIDRLDGTLAEAVRASNDAVALRSIAMLDADGRIVAYADTFDIRPENSPPGRGRRARLGLTPPEFVATAVLRPDAHWQRRRLEGGPLVLDVAMPTVSGLRWGTLVATFDLAGVEARTQMTRSVLVCLALLLTLTVIVTLRLALGRTVVQPIEELARAAADLRRGLRGSRAALKSRDELGRLATDFNAMADEIESYTVGLERKVEERSAEVRRKNEQLERVNVKLAGAVEELGRLARVDGLTGLLNRRSFDEALDFEVRRGERSAHVFCVIMIDIDHFKNYNDSHGHPAGDRALKAISGRLREQLRATDVLARYGGEEFVALLLDTDPAAGLRVAEGLRAAVEGHSFEHDAEQPLGTVTASFGLAAFPIDGLTAEGILAAADRALYAAKASGRNRVVVAQADGEAAER